MTSSNKNIMIAMLSLAFFGLAGSFLVSSTNEITYERIIFNQQQALRKQLQELVSPELFDNALATSTVELTDSEALGRELAIAYIGEKNKNLSAIVFEATAPNGYAGAINMLVAVDHAGTLLGVRVVTHKETPGLGDKIELEKSNWILDFNGKSLRFPDESKWKVKKDGGVFDQFTGATVTPRVIVQRVYAVLKYYQAHGQQIYTDYLKMKPNEQL